MSWPYDVRRKDLRIEFYRGSGKGGQHRNKTDSACRITHIETGVSAQAEDERSQHMNRRLAFRRLAAKLVPMMKAEITKNDVKKKRSTERVRTYHAVRGAVKDDRVPELTFDYEETLDGNLEPIIEAITQKMAQEK